VSGSVLREKEFVRHDIYEHTSLLAKPVPT